MRLMGKGNAELALHLQRCAVKILRFGMAPRVGSRMAIDKQRIVLETFFDLALQRKQMFGNGSRWSEVVAEYLRNPGETLFF